jgi:hypothetical protein
MSNRSAKRAAARAGLRCLVCGKRLRAERATKRYCSTAHRIKASRDRPPKHRPGRLSRPQVRILTVLNTSNKVLTRREVAELSGVSIGHLADLMGQFDPERRATREAKIGRPSLLTLGLVRVHHLGGPGEEVNT